MRRHALSIVIAALVSGMLSGMALASGLPVVYEEDFSTPPRDWITNDFTGGNFYRGAPDFDLHLEHGNESGLFARVEVVSPENDDFTLEFDVKVNNADNGGGTKFGLWDPEMNWDALEPLNRSSLVTVDFAQRDSAKGVFLEWIGSDGVLRSASDPLVWGSSWFHAELAYDAIAGTATLQVTDGKGPGGAAATGAIVLNGLVGGARLTSDVNRLGTSGIGDYATSAANSDYEVDNIVLAVAVPAPSTLVGLLGMGVVALMFVCCRRSSKAS